jgi:hypothetical protein
VSDGKKIVLWWSYSATLWVIFVVLAMISHNNSGLQWTWLGSMFGTEACGIIGFICIMSP